MIKNLNRDVDITECYILWVIIGNPSKLSVFSPRNREFQADYIKKSITLQLDDFYCPIKTSYKLSEGCTISVNTYCSTANYEPNNIKIKLVGWSEDCIYFKIAKSNYNNSNLNNSSNSSESHSQLDDDTDVLINFEVTICILSFHHEKLNIDNREGEKYSLSLIGHDLTENTKVIPFTSVDELGPDQIKYLQKMEASIKRFDDDVGSLKLSDYEMNRNEIPRKNGRVSKWVSVKNRDQKFAFKSISNKKYKGTIQNQVAILKKLHNCNNIIKFYGLVSDGDKWYLVTEWAEYGNLREFYTNHKERFNLRLKLRMSLEIARGLDFLKNVEVLHHDIRAENILINLDETAKLTKQARYYAPELLERNSNTKYDIKCEIYSFGILLWEIAEEKTPYKNYKDIMEIVKFVGAKNREPFSRNSQMPEQFKHFFLNNCFEKSKSTYSHKSQSILIDRASFLIDAASSTGAAIAEAVAAGVSIAIPFSKFVPLFYEIGNIFNEIIELAQAAEHNKRTCDALLQRVYAAELAVQDLKRQRNSKEFFNNKNYLCLQNLVNIIVQIRKFISDISQMKSLIKYFQVKSIENSFKELCKEFDSCVNILSFEINVDTSDEIRQLKADQEDLLKYIQGMGDGNIKKIDDTSYVKDDAKEIKACLANLSKEFSSTVAKVNAMSTGAAIAEAVAAGVPIAIPFSKFVPLFYEIGNIFNEIIELAQAAEHNKRTCDALLQRVYAAELAVQDLKRQRNSKEFFNNKNYLCLQNLVNIIVQIRKFISDISQMKSLIKYFLVKSIEKTFKELCKEFDSCVNILSFEINVDTSDEIRQLKADQEDLLKYIQGMGDGNIKKIDDTSYVKDDAKEIKACLANLSKEFSSTVAKVNAMNNTMEKFMNETSQNQRKIDNIFQTHPLKFADYERDNNEKPRKNGRVTKWYKIKSMDEEFAFKTISEKEDQKIVQNQVTILKELYDWQNIIKFYGITYDGNKWYLVTEWAEYGNLREFYQNKHDFELKLKLRISLDIARGLNFLRTVEIIHRDIRAENILITLNETAKLANFKLSRYLTGSSINQSQNLERVRYCAPELLERAPNYKYDQKCEVYSFGILLWEIAEKRIPYQGNDDILDITDKVRNKMYREPFSAISQMPDKFKELQIDAVQHDPDFRPKITKMFEVLRNCVEDYSERHSLLRDSPSSSSSELNRKPSTPKPISKRAYSIDQEAYTLPIDLPDFESFKYMTLADAAKQHRLYDKHGKLVGNVKIAYKCFEAYANLSNTGGTANRNQIKAKYYKAYYISKGLVESPPNKDKIVAELFKEVADDEANEFPEAKVRYGDYLYHGKGVDQNFTEALKYFEKAAEDGFKVAMYNAGNIYYNGISGIKDREKAIHYMKLAAYNDYEPAIKFCKEHNL
ncbi:unnamed protein product [Rhizophagus irregularis]|nr:unnamed protein product [Rhizophagus irregularis]